MTQGFGVMYDYRSRITPEDRWAIAAYIRALQLSQGATIADVPADARPALESAAAGARVAPFPVNADDWLLAVDEGPTDPDLKPDAKKEH
jgi:hypothetical protein